MVGVRVRYAEFTFYGKALDRTETGEAAGVGDEQEPVGNAHARSGVA